MADIFDEDGSPITLTSSQDWNKIAESRFKDGIREGVSTGQEASLQEGFNQGFQSQLKPSLCLGFMSGAMSGILALKDAQGVPHLTEYEMSNIEQILARLHGVKCHQNIPGEKEDGDLGGEGSTKGSSGDDHLDLEIMAEDKLFIRDARGHRNTDVEDGDAGEGSSKTDLLNQLGMAEDVKGHQNTAGKDGERGETMASSRDKSIDCIDKSTMTTEVERVVSIKRDYTKLVQSLLTGVHSNDLCSPY